MPLPTHSGPPGTELDARLCAGLLAGHLPGKVQIVQCFRGSVQQVRVDV